MVVTLLQKGDYKGHQPALMVSEQAILEHAQMLAIMTMNIPLIKNGCMIATQVVNVFSVYPPNDLPGRVVDRFHVIARVLGQQVTRRQWGDQPTLDRLKR